MLASGKLDKECFPLAASNSKYVGVYHCSAETRSYLSFVWLLNTFPALLEGRNNILEQLRPDSTIAFTQHSKLFKLLFSSLSTSELAKRKKKIFNRHISQKPFISRYRLCPRFVKQTNPASGTFPQP